MSITIKSAGLSGVTVVRPTANLPQTATFTMFTVTGAVLVHFIAGLVTTALGATVTTLSVGNTPTGSGNVPASIATATTVTSASKGQWYVPTFAAGVAGAAVVANAVNLDRSFLFVVPGGTISWTTSANDTGQMSWYINYTPLDAGASVS